jgi:hypothetical protein
LSKCGSCGRENVDTQMIEVGERTLLVCPRCYVQIKKSQLQIEQVGQTSVSDGKDSILSKTLDSLIDWIEKLQDRQNAFDEVVAHNAELSDHNFASLLKKVNTLKELQNEVTQLKEEFQRLRSRIEQLEIKSSEKKKD